MMRMLCDGPLKNTAGLGSPGVDEVRWTRPVRPGTVLSCRHLATEKRDLASKPDVGLTRITIELLDEKGEVLCWWHTNQLTRKRHPRPAPAAPSASKPPRAKLRSLWDIDGPQMDPDRGMFFEDRQIGEITDLGGHTFGRDEIIAFAREFDPQPFHLDDAAAKASLFGALCASGWHTSAIFIRQIITNRKFARTKPTEPGARRPVYGPSPGFRDLRWPKPVYVGDTIEFRARIAEKIDMKSRPTRGILASEVQARNQHGDIVFAVMSQILVDRREPFRA
jgi:acyl dehydratase